MAVHLAYPLEGLGVVGVVPGVHCIESETEYWRSTNVMVSLCHDVTWRRGGSLTGPGTWRPPLSGTPRGRTACGGEKINDFCIHKAGTKLLSRLSRYLLRGIINDLIDSLC